MWFDIIIAARREHALGRFGTGHFDEPRARSAFHVLRQHNGLLYAELKKRVNDFQEVQQ